MEIKKIIFILITLIYINNSKESVVDKAYDINLVGKWYISSYVYGMIETKCYSCPEIDFAMDDNGKITIPSKEEIKFRYSLDLHKRAIIFYFENCDSYFAEKKYFIKDHTEDDLEMLVLISQDNSSKYTFSRIINMN